jgi:hypothetical protein
MSVILQLSPYWERVVSDYYDTAYQDQRNITIWTWLEQDYRAQRTLWNDQIRMVDELKFADEQDAVLFVLRFT